MLKLIKGCKVPKNRLLKEEYQKLQFGYIANVDSDKIRQVFIEFIMRQTQMLCFILELPTHADEEKKLRKNDDDPYHKDVYYIDGLNREEAFALVERYGDLLIQDGLNHFGFGVQDNSAEIMLDKYNVISVYTQDFVTYDEFFKRLKIPETKRIKTAWDTFTQNSPGESNKIEVDGKTVYDIPNELKDWGIYFAERRED